MAIELSGMQIPKSNDYAAWVWYKDTSIISDQNYTPLSSITSLLHPFSNRKIQSLRYRIFLVCLNILLMQYDKRFQNLLPY